MAPSLAPAAAAGIMYVVMSDVGCSREYDDLVGWVVFGCLVSFTTALGIGANDVANAFSTSVGSGTISMKQATLIASIFEFSGAVLVGKGVTKTVKKKIIDPKMWADQPEYLMLGCVSTLIGCTAWLALATKYKMPVSTTHTVVGGLLGFGLFTKPDAVRWNKLVLIFISWVTAPVMSGITGATLFFVYRHFVLRKEDSLNVARKSMPFVIVLVFFVGFSFIFIKGPKFLKDEMNDADNNGTGKEASDRMVALAYAMLGAILVTIPLVLVAVPKMYQRVLTQPLTDFPWYIPTDAEGRRQSVECQVQEKKPDGEDAGGDLKNVTEMKKVPEEEAVDNEALRAQVAEKFDERTEGLVSYLQVISACFDSFAHGANDTANAIGPFAALWSLYRHGSVKDDVPLWIMVVGGAGLVIGLYVWGGNIIQAMGKDLLRITPSRGFAIEVGSATMVIFCSAMEIPTSTTHCQVGATLGVGLLEGKKDAINTKLVLKIFFGWVITLVIAGMTSGTLFLMLKEIVCAQLDHSHSTAPPVASNSSD
jgi:sodium-dependent phosphate transporter